MLLLFDPQTAGGLLIAVDREDADALLRDLTGNVPSAQRIGEIQPYDAVAGIFWLLNIPGYMDAGLGSALLHSFYAILGIIASGTRAPGIVWSSTGSTPAPMSPASPSWATCWRWPAAIWPKR